MKITNLNPKVYTKQTNMQQIRIWNMIIFQTKSTKLLNLTKNSKHDCFQILISYVVAKC
jgi:hypothetical protein